jgi:hypothetical protein
MTKIIAAFLAIFLITSCAISEAKKEVAKTAKSQASTSRINASEHNSKDTLKELDE